MATVYKCIDCRFQGVVADATEKSWTCPECGRTYKMWNPLEGGPMTPHADLVARLRQDGEILKMRGGFPTVASDMLEAADALAALPPPADPQMAPAAESWCAVCTGTGKPLTGARCDLCRGTGKSSEALIGLRELLYAAERERDENEGVFKVWRRRCEQAEAALASRPADPPALVALVREYQQKYARMMALSSREDDPAWTQADEDELRAACRAEEASHRDLLAYPLPAAPPPTTTVGSDPVVVVNGRQYSMGADGDMRVVWPVTDTPQGKDYEALYYDLLYQVGNKYPGESRHDTAKRYLNERETLSGDAKAQSYVAAPPQEDQ